LVAAKLSAALDVRGRGKVASPSVATMSLLFAPIPTAWALLGWLALVPAVLFLVLRGGRRAALRGAQQHLWLAGAVVLALLWTLQARTAGVAAFGLFGTALYSLVFGRYWAQVGLLAALALQTTLGAGSWANFGLNAVLLALMPPLLAGALQRQVETRLPGNIFVFIIGNGLFVTLVVTAATGVLFVACARMLGTAVADPDQIAYALLLAWGESLASGMLFSALVIFLPDQVLTYRRDAYLPPRRRL
jgi:uncharacterized membrane protein